jgi:hypothetical protein
MPDRYLFRSAPAIRSHFQSARAACLKKLAPDDRASDPVRNPHSRGRNHPRRWRRGDHAILIAFEATASPRGRTPDAEPFPPRSLTVTNPNQSPSEPSINDNLPTSNPSGMSILIVLGGIVLLAIALLLYSEYMQ